MSNESGRKLHLSFSLPLLTSAAAALLHRASCSGLANTCNRFARSINHAGAFFSQPQTECEIGHLFGFRRVKLSWSWLNCGFSSQIIMSDLPDCQRFKWSRVVVWKRVRRAPSNRESLIISFDQWGSWMRLIAIKRWRNNNNYRGRSRIICNVSLKETARTGNTQHSDWATQEEGKQTGRCCSVAQDKAKLSKQTNSSWRLSV